MPMAWALPAAVGGAAALAAALLGLAGAARAIEAVAGPCDDCEGTGSGSGDSSSGDTVRKEVSTSGGDDSEGGPATPHSSEPAKAVLGSARPSMEQHARYELALCCRPSVLATAHAHAICPLDA